MLRRCVDGLLVYLFSRRYRIWITRGREGEGECCKLSLRIVDMYMFVDIFVEKTFVLNF